jgi:hypothetical protein
MKLRQKFSQWTHVIHSIEPKTNVLGRFGPFCYSTKVDAKLVELAPLTHRFGKRSCVGCFSQRMHPIHSIGPKTHILGRFRLCRYCTKVDAKLNEQVPLTHRFTKRSCVEIFRNERSWSTPLDEKLKFWSISDCFVTARNSMQNWPNWHH